MRIDRLAHVVQQGRQEELLIIREFLPGQLEHLKAMIERVALGMQFRVLLDLLQRQQKHLVEAEPVAQAGAAIANGPAAASRPTSR